jgi:tripartite-type tricarboxylate transporter receptor subunit TctC
MISAPHAVAPALYRKLGYDLMRDFTPVALLGSEPLCVVVHPSLPVKSVHDLVALLKQRPGQVSYGSTGNGAVNHLATELFKSRAAVDMVHVPYKGSAFSIPDAISGVVPVLFANVSTLQPHIESRRLRAIAVTSRQRVRTLPGVPTIAESGYPGFEMVPWIAVIAPRGLPAEASKSLGRALQETLADPTVRANLEKSGVDVAWQPGNTYDAKVAEELPRLRAYVYKAKIQAE